MAGPVGNTNRLVHGGYSESRNRATARAQKRRLLARTGMHASELTGPQLAFLDAWAGCAAKVRAIDTHLAEVGLLDEQGQPRPVLALYTSLVNASRVAMQRLEASLAERRRDSHEPLARLAEEGRVIRLRREAEGP